VLQVQKENKSASKQCQVTSHLPQESHWMTTKPWSIS